MNAPVTGHRYTIPTAMTLASQDPKAFLEKSIKNFFKEADSKEKLDILATAIRRARIDTVIFDLDGTLINTEKVEFDLVEKELRENFNIELSPKEKLIYRGFDNQKFFAAIFINRQKDLDPTEAKVMADDFDNSIKAKKKALFEDGTIKAKKKALFEDGTIKAYDPMIKLVKALKDKKFKIALVTNSGREAVRRNLQHIKLSDAFNIQITKENGKKSKPAPEPYLEALKKLGTDPGRALVFEDSANGLKSAKEAGAKVVYINNEKDWDLDPEYKDQAYLALDMKGLQPNKS